MENGNKPAYPISKDHIDGRDYKGLSKREAFAMAAMQGILAHSVNYMAAEPIDAAADAVKCADELLKQLE